MERRLAAILVTDVVGYSSLIRTDEEGTLAALKTLRADIIDPKLAEHHGRVVKLTGDGTLMVIARNLSFTFKGQAVNVREIARDLGVKYDLETLTALTADQRKQVLISMQANFPQTLGRNLDITAYRRGSAFVHQVGGAH